ncbi:SDR family NAD(P)-dependent oxidoreductase [Streptomyces sp. NPDC053048]|uniref:SDR family NAD(P)-dependent oxidoreductase n=1 Tax=Streptomyces sp. NPDC053048 TaxID=3365694 RepID=UPI0037CE62B9
MTARFTGRTVLVTGGGTGIGRGIALAFAREGARVVVAGRREEPLKETVVLIEAAGGEAAAITADVTRSEDVRALVERTVARYGGLDVAVNNVGMLAAGGVKVADIADEDWQATLDTNLTGVWLSMKHEIEHMRANGGGAIVNVSSVLGAHNRLPGLGAYATSKAAVTALTRSAALDHIGDGIRINAVSPGPVETPMSSRPGESAAQKAERLREQVPAGRAATPQEIAASVLHLASDEAGYAVGTDLVLDGGITA